MLAGKGRGWPKGRALFVFRQDSGIIAWRSDLQVLYEAHLVLAARSESWFPWKMPDSMWQGLFAVAGVIVHSCHSSLRYLLQSTLPWVVSPFNTCCPSSQDWVSAAEAAPSLHMQFQRGHKDAMGVCAFQLLCCPTRTPRKSSRTVTEPRGALQRPTFWNNPSPACPCLLALCDKCSGWNKYFRPRPSLSQAVGMAVFNLPGVLTQRAVIHSLSNMPW